MTCLILLLAIVWYVQVNSSSLIITFSQGKGAMASLFEEYLAAGENWNATSVVQTHKRKNSMKMTGNEHYVAFRDLVTKYGEDNAKNLRTSKKQLQQRSGDLYPDVPHWFKHPDFPGVEVAWWHS